MASTILVLERQRESSTDLQQILLADTGSRMLSGNLLMKYIRSLMGGARSAVLKTMVGVVKATGTITLAAHVDTNTVTINGIVLTCGTEYTGATDTLKASSLASAINAHVTLGKMVFATSNLGVVTLTALVPGAIGNAVTLAISANGTVSAARMAGGSNGDAEKTYSYGTPA